MSAGSEIMQFGGKAWVWCLFVTYAPDGPRKRMRVLIAIFADKEKGAQAAKKFWDSRDEIRPGHILKSELQPYEMII